MGKRKSQNPRKIISIHNDDDSDSDVSIFENKQVGRETFKITESNKLSFSHNIMGKNYYYTNKTNINQDETFDEDSDYSVTSAKRMNNSVPLNYLERKEEFDDISDIKDNYNQTSSTMVVFPDMIKSGILTANARRNFINNNMKIAMQVESIEPCHNNINDKKLFNPIGSADMEDPLDLSIDQSDSTSDDSWHNNKDPKKFNTVGCYVPRRRNQTYPPTFKLAVVQYAEKHGVMAAARYYDVSPKRVRVWRTSTMKQTIIKKIKKQGLDILEIETGSSTDGKEKSNIPLSVNTDTPIKTETVNKCTEITEKSIHTISRSGKYCCRMKEKTIETQNRTIPVWEIELFANLRKQLNSKNSIKIKKLIETAKKLQPSHFKTEENGIPTLWIVQWCVKFGVGFETNKCCDICAIPKELTENIVIRKVKPAVAGQGIVEKQKKLRKTYSPDFKLQVVDFALHNTQRAAARKYGVAQKRVFAWVLAKDELQEIQNSNNPQKQDVEEVDRLLWKWRKDMIDKGKDVSKRMICAQARFQFKKKGNATFVGNNQWYNNWIKRIKKKGFHLDIPSSDTESLKNIMEQDINIKESGCS